MSAPERHQTHRAESDEIDLRDIALAIYAGWKWIAISILACVAAGSAYAFIADPQYSTDIAYIPAPEGLRALESMPGSYESLSVFEEFNKRLSSYNNFKSFYDQDPGYFTSIKKENELPEIEPRSFFTKNIKLTSPSDDSDSSRTIAINYSNSLEGPTLLNDYFQWTEKNHINDLADRADRAVDRIVDQNRATMDAHLKSQGEDTEARITRLREEDQIRIAELEDELQAVKQSIVSSREERIRILENAEQIALRLGIEKPTTPRDLGRQSSENDVVYAEINSQDGIPLYFMGTEALSAERVVIESNLEEEVKTAEVRNIEQQLQQLKENQTINALLRRESLSPFSVQHNELRQQNAILAAKNISEEEIDVASVSHWAYQPGSPDSPRIRLIVSLSLILGAMIGIFLLLAARFFASVKNHREKVA
ncbi:Wzz/FepE/Etk N-terminal domain-containing protein [Halomonas aquatica]|uniref:Wzz/FepE/Etk N-terminal domain-containing protein n=1 Tax=Halomonas aquatica TaxID=3151123 RepID=A0ABV1ND94_9GAMM